MVLLFQYGVSKHGIGGLTDMLMAQRAASTESKFLSLGCMAFPIRTMCGVMSFHCLYRPGIKSLPRISAALQNRMPQKAKKTIRWNSKPACQFSGVAQGSKKFTELLKRSEGK